MKTTLKTALLPAPTASLRRNEMWELYNRYYNTDQQSFFDRFQTNDYYAVYMDNGSLVGFTGFRTRMIETPYGKVKTLYIGQTVMDQLYRGQSIIPRTCCRIFAQHFLSNPFGPIYVWCDALTYKPYLLFANALDEYYPRRERLMPPKIKAIVDQLGEHYYGANYSSEKGTVRKPYNSINDQTAIIHPDHLTNPAIAFYAKSNPAYTEGHGLITLAPITFRNFFFLVKKCLKKRFSK